MIDIKTNKAVRLCMKSNMPFVCFMTPFAQEAEFMACLPPSSDTLSCEIKGDDIDSFDGFVIGMFELSDKLRPIGISRQFTASEIIEMENDMPKYDSACVFTSPRSTDPIHYRAQIHSVIKSLNGLDEKTVMSRMLVVDSDNDPLIVAHRYFQAHPSCFRYMYYTYDTGLWIGATPELLLHYDHDSTEVVSMSVAGTRKVSVQGDWDIKNVLEHDIVTRYIQDVMQKYCNDVSVEERKAVFGEIEHLCHEVRGKGRVSLAKMLPELNPTPAVCGWPREKSYRQICDLETHQRNCYGGFVGICGAVKANLYVNLRCALVDNPPGESVFRYNLFAGGGITKKSKVAGEWNETEIKMKSLLKCFD